MKFKTNHCRAITKKPVIAQTALALKLDAYLTIITNMFTGGLGLWVSVTAGWWGAWLDVIGGENLDIIIGGGDGNTDENTDENTN